ncbi:MAG: (E)-4-hydroxy-3-methylbut-2-enyl-diphosphate synthase [Bacteroidales bacterium]|nr:(E)-4-hydroxy-3-methylbut-2-enyl-diphosphate synthase [Bacteroidales bacterium]
MEQEKTYHIPVSKEIAVGNLKMGGTNPVVIQSMANTDTNDIHGSVTQAKKIIQAGGEMVRFTTQGLREVYSLKKITESLRSLSIKTPVVADVHFNAKIALKAAEVCEKVRINPGNFAEKYRYGKLPLPADRAAAEVNNRSKLISLINTCKKHNTALRIGVNHGSLSGRIMSEWGDTPEGMTESALEFLRVCNEQNFSNVAVSLKSSNSGLMVRSVRLLVSRMIKEGIYYPVHLGVTESGDGPEGRIKSVAGIAPLLLEGVGDTIRVSLTEPPENEIPIADLIRKCFPVPKTLPYHPFENLPRDPFRFDEPYNDHHDEKSGSGYPVVVSDDDTYAETSPDILYKKSTNSLLLVEQGKEIKIQVCHDLKKEPPGSEYVLINAGMNPGEAASLRGEHVFILDMAESVLTDIKHWLLTYYRLSGQIPVILHRKYRIRNYEEYAIRASGEFSFFLIDRLVDGIWIQNPHTSNEFNNRLSFYTLQAAGNRITSTEYIACPSCGRTLFDIQKILSEVKAATSHLTGLKIAVMGCIVNGPGEMADADYGYIGAGKGMVNIYRKKTCLIKNVPAEKAIEKLIAVIKENGDWIDP